MLRRSKRMADKNATHVTEVLRAGGSVTRLDESKTGGEIDKD